MTITRTEPPYAADEVTMLRSFLDYFRATIRRQASGLTREQLQVRLGPSTMTLGGLVKHLAFVEQWWFTGVLRGEPAAGIWADVDWDADRDWDWNSAAQHSSTELDTLLAEEIGRSEETLATALASGDLDQLAKRPRSGGEVATLRWILVHLIEEYARHCGHADLIREAIDGATDL